MNTNFNIIVSKLVGIYQRKSQYHRTKIGALFITSNDNYKFEITLSRSFIRDKHLRNQGHKDFDEKAYFLNLEQTLICLTEISSNDVAKTVTRSLNSTNNSVWDNKINQNIIYDFDEINNMEDLDLYETQQLMAEMGFPTEFGSKKLNQNRRNSKNVQKNDMKLIFSDLNQKVIDLLRDPDSVYREFNSIISTCSVDSLNESQSIEQLQRIIRDFIRRKFINWINQLNISNGYKSCIKLENPDYLKQILNSVGLAFEAPFEIQKCFLYPLVPDKSIRFSEKNDLSFTKKYDEIGDDLFVASDRENPMNKYYFQRYRYFDRFDQGILLDEESWYSVTPGALAEQVAHRYHQVFSESSNNPIMIDAFCGAGGNAIRFAEYGFIVLAIDMDIKKLKLLMHNAAIYEVDKRIVPVCCDFYKLQEWIKSEDCFDELRDLFVSVLAVHISPPWGGPEYLEMDMYNIGFMDFWTLMKTALNLSPNVSCFLPRHSNCQQIVSWLTLNSISNCNSVEIEQNCLQNKVKALTLYTGQLFQFIDLGML